MFHPDWHARNRRVGVMPNQRALSAPLAGARARTGSASSRMPPDGGSSSRGSRMIAEAQGYAQKRVNEAEGDAALFTSVFEQYKKAPEITRKRIYLETMEKVIGSSKKVITDSNQTNNGILPLLPLNDLGSKPAEKGVQK